MIEEKAFKSEFKVNEVSHDSILLLGPFEYKNNYLVFGLDQCSYIIEKNEEDKEADTPEGSEELSEVLFTINRTYY